jgi:16S rRNA (guanine966-N2)-methyltransferase
MRIISGYLKGKNILLPSDKKTRPLKDMVRESIFNIIKHTKSFNNNIEHSTVLDLFSGTGSFGLECISRGASQVIFNENYPLALEILRKNIYNLKCENKCKINNHDCFNVNQLKNIKKLSVLKKNGVIVIHRHKKEIDTLPKDFNILDERIYGLSKIIFGN